MKTFATVERSSKPGHQPLPRASSTGQRSSAAHRARIRAILYGPSAEKVQTKQAPGQTPRLAPAVEEELASLTGGQPLAPAERAFFEPRFGRSFEAVRIHTDPTAARLAAALSARAFTLGRSIVFADQYAPGTDAGRRLLAHELVHTIQQRPSGPGSGMAAASSGGPARTPAAAAPGSVAVRMSRAAPDVQRLGDTSKIPAGLSCEPAPDSPIFVVDNVMFENRVTALSALNLEQIENFVRNWWAAGGNHDVRVDGFASTPGTDELNWQLSCDRAQTVASELMHPSSGVQPGIPASFISVFMQGETAEFGADAENRRATLSLSGAGTTPPLPLPQTTDPTVENCRRARQVECVIRELDGCTLPGGVMGPEHIEAANERCRAETDHEGPAVTPTPEECRSGLALPSAQACREVNSICGPDISQPLAAVLADVRSLFAAWSHRQRGDVCDSITALAFSDYKMAWDIHELFLPETGWLCRLPYHGPCGRPPDTDCDDEDSRDCGNSVLVDGKCFLAGTVNYALLGQICRLCNDAFGRLSEDTMRWLIKGQKLFTLDDPGPPTAWARAGFHGYPGHVPVQENRGHCKGRCPVPYSRGPFTWVWEPHHPR